MSNARGPTTVNWILVLRCGLSVAVLFAPAFAFLVGQRGKPIENRASVEFSGLDGGWDSFADLGAFVADRLPLRERAVRSDAWVDESVFGEDPAFGGSASPRVVRGRDGFLFLADAIDTACAPNAPVSDTVRNLAALSATIRASGRDVVTMVAPDKSSVHPELLPEDLPKARCFADYSDDLWGSMATADIAGYVDLRASLRSASADSNEPLYLRKDSHWDSAGSLVAIRQAVDHFAPGVWNPDEVRYAGLGDYVGDLTGMQGRPESDQAPIYAVERPYVTNVSTVAIDDVEGGFNRRFVNRSDTPGRLVGGRTVMFLDSYGLVALPQLVPFFEDLTVVRLVDYAPEKFRSLIAESERVWLLTVERGASFRLSFEIGSPEFVDSLRTNLPAR
jgi:alginate O-acetyltransferase complex protein AlgJ